MISWALRRRRRFVPTQRPSTIRLRASLLDEANAIVDRDYASELSLDDIARRVASSRRQLQRAYAEIGETTFRDHLTRVRMERAAELLAARQLTVREVAHRVGYRQPAQFAKAFRRHRGVSPSDFRAGGGSRGRRARGARAPPSASCEPSVAASHVGCRVHGRRRADERPSHRSPREESRAQVRTMLLIGAVASALGIALALLIDWFPAPASEQAGTIDTLWDVLLIASVPIFVLVETIVLYCAIKFRMRPGEELKDGPPIHGNTQAGDHLDRDPGDPPGRPLHLRLRGADRHREGRGQLDEGARGGRAVHVDLLLPG